MGTGVARRTQTLITRVWAIFSRARARARNKSHTRECVAPSSALFVGSFKCLRRWVLPIERERVAPSSTIVVGILERLRRWVPPASGYGCRRCPDTHLGHDIYAVPFLKI